MGIYCGCGHTAKGESADAKWFRDSWLETGKKLDMGRACVRFKKIEDVPLDVVGAAIKRMPANKCIETYESSIGVLTSRAKPASTSAAKGAARRPTKATAGK